MSQQVEITGRLVGGFDGNLVDSKTGEMKKLSPSLKVIDSVTFETYSVAVNDEEYKAFAPMVGRDVKIAGVLVRPAQAARLQALKIEHAKAPKS